MMSGSVIRTCSRQIRLTAAAQQMCGKRVRGVTVPIPQFGVGWGQRRQAHSGTAGNDCELPSASASPSPSPSPSTSSLKPAKSAGRVLTLLDPPSALKPSPVGPVTGDEFHGLMKRVGAAAVPDDDTTSSPASPRSPRVICVAVSGGPDSMALAWLLHQWAASQPSPVSVAGVIVDHDLRSDSGEEAAAVKARLTAMGLDTVVVAGVEWGDDGQPTVSKLQTAARDRRYALLCNVCQRLGSTEVYVAQHLNDFVETFLHRFARASGLDGLSSIVPTTTRGDTFKVVRPLLTVPKSRLLDTCAAANLEWVDDPSNQNMNYDRVRIREAIRRMSGDDDGTGTHDGRLSVSKLGDVVQFFAHTRVQMDSVVSRLLQRSVTVHPNTGFAMCRVDALCGADVPPEISVRALTRLVQTMGGRSHPPGLARIQSLYETLVENRLGVTHHCSGALVTPAPSRRTKIGRDGAILKYSKKVDNEPPRVMIMRETPSDRHFLSTRHPVTVGEPTLWDNRFVVTVTQDASVASDVGSPPPTTDLYVVRTGKYSLAKLLQMHVDLRYLWPFKRHVLSGLPVVVHCPAGSAFTSMTSGKNGLATAIAQSVVAIPTIQHSLVPGLSATAEWAPSTPLFPDTAPLPWGEPL